MTLELPASFRARIAGTFGAAGAAWLERLPAIVDRCVERWSLLHVRPVEEFSYSWVATSESPYGPAVLKISVPNPETNTEIAALGELRGGRVCSLHAADPSLCAILVERLIPGSTLWAGGDFHERVRVASALFRALHAPPRASGVGSPAALATGSTFPNYRDQAARAFALARRELGAGGAWRVSAPESAEGAADSPWREDLLTAVAAAERLERAVTKRPDRSGADALLHGDLHHGNMLLHGGEWRIIDPKGVFGPVWLEPARFILNQIGGDPTKASVGSAASPAPEREFNVMVGEFAGALNVDPALVALGATVDAAVTACWTLEEGANDAEMRSTTQRTTLIRRLARPWVTSAT